MINLYRQQDGYFVHIPNVKASSIESLFTNLAAFLPRIGNLDNIFYSVNHSEPGNARRFTGLDHIFYDLDVSDQDLGRMPQEYIDTVAGALSVPVSAMTVVMSGHGYHFLVKIPEHLHINDELSVSVMQSYYKQSMRLIENALKEKGLSGKLDMVFDKARVLRLPNTVNSKKGRERVETKLIQLSNEEYPLNLKSLAGIKLVEEKRPSESANERNLELVRNVPDLLPNVNTNLPALTDEYIWDGSNPDSVGVQTGCDFLKKCKDNQNDIIEPQWYAMLSIIARLPNGRNLAHEYSKEHEYYKYHDVEQKLEQALQKSGPRTCTNIDVLWDGCKSCPNYGKVKSPIQLKSPEFIATKQTGFYEIIAGKNGIKKIPNYIDLLKHFDQKHTHATLSNNVTYVWDKTHYKEFADIYIEGFAQDNFNPKPTQAMRNEFLHTVKKTNIMSEQEIIITNSKINLKNGVYDIETKKLLPHSPRMLFTSTIDCEYDPAAAAPEFEKWINEVTSFDHEKRDALLDFMAYALAGTNIANDTVLIMTGEGSNGKTTFLRLMKKLFAESMSFSTARILASQFGKAKLEGKRACVIEEVPSYKDMDFWEEVKNLASGGVVSIEKKFKNSYEIQNTCRLIFTCNKLPSATDINHGFLRRLLIINFGRIFTEDESINNFENLLAHELSGILNILILRIEKLKESNYKIRKPKSSIESVKDYALAQDDVLRFVDEKICLFDSTIHKGSIASVTEWDNGAPFLNPRNIYMYFSNWCEEEGIKNIPKKNQFSRKFGSYLDAKFKDSKVITKKADRMQSIYKNLVVIKE